MWAVLEREYAVLSDADKALVKKEAEPFGRNVRFRGFDGNHEADHLVHALFLIEDFGLYQIFKGRDLNSYTPLLDVYRRMFKVFEPMRSPVGLQATKLSASDIIGVLKEILHPQQWPFLLKPLTGTLAPIGQSDANGANRAL